MHASRAGSPSRRSLLLQAAAAASAALPGFAAAAERDPVVETRSGKVRGFVRGGVEHYFGVPYGGSVSGKGRFRAAPPPTPWRGIRDATAYGPPSVQPLGTILSANGTSPSEECLVLNVWTPAANGHRRPVMVYNHGGGFTTGSGASRSQDGANLARTYDVVVVESNHRLGLLGYLHLADLPGASDQVDVNCGLHDLRASLRWVRDNIAAFGGDPSRVMIFGESGGGAKTACLYSMPSVQSLFHRASIESAPALRMSSRDAAGELTTRVLRELQIAPAAWRQLYDVPAETLLGVQQRLTGGAPAPGQRLAIQPFVDGDLLPNHPFDPVAPEVSRAKPLIVGYNRDETVFFNLIRGDRSVFGLDDAGLRTRLAAELPEAEEAIELYRRTRPDASPSQLYIAITTAMFAGAGAVRMAERKARQGGAPAYAYVYTYPLETLAPGTSYPLGAMHASEIPFKFFNMDGVTSRGQANLSGARPERYAAGRHMSGFWTSFARDGRPSAPDAPRWPAYDLERRATMILDAQCRVEDDPYAAEREFWAQREMAS